MKGYTLSCGCYISRYHRPCLIHTAAPELLSACDELLSIFHDIPANNGQGFDDYDMAVVNQARAAIAKARGE